jgi:hypothetical protein
MDNLIVVIPYGNANAQVHFAYGNGEGDVTKCGRDCYGWSLAGRNVEPSDLTSVYTCKRCIKRVAK